MLDPDGVSTVMHVMLNHNQMVNDLYQPNIKHSLCFARLCHRKLIIIVNYWAASYNHQSCNVAMTIRRLMHPNIGVAAVKCHPNKSSFIKLAGCQSTFPRSFKLLRIQIMLGCFRVPSIDDQIPSYHAESICMEHGLAGPSHICQHIAAAAIHQAALLQSAREVPLLLVLRGPICLTAVMAS